MVKENIVGVQIIRVKKNLHCCKFGIALVMHYKTKFRYT